MAWITLALAPILILLVFQFMFLPYHSHLATWTHRLLILAELAAVFLLWPLVLDARRDFQWPTLRHPLPWITVLLFAGISLSVATFPGEPHVNLATGQQWSSVQCNRGFQRRFDLADLRFDRLILPNVDVVDDEKLAKIEKATSERQLPAYQGERTQNFANRNLSCADLDGGDLRRVNLTGAQMSGSSLHDTVLQGAFLNLANLQDATLNGAQLQGASLFLANLKGASLIAVQLQDANLNWAQLQGASLFLANLKGAFLNEAKLQGAFLNGAQLQGAKLNGTQLQGANLNRAQLQGATLNAAQLQGADLSDVQW